MIALCEPYLSGREWPYVKECFDSGWIATAGPFLKRFEDKICQFTGAPYAVGVSSGTAALHLALLVVGVEPNEEVLVPTITFIAPVNAVRYIGAHPVLMDVNPKTWQMDVKKVERFLRKACDFKEGICINKKTGRRVKAILAVHLLGLCCEMDVLAALAKEFQLKLIEDAAEALGVRYRGRHVGTFGDVGALSFNANKLVTAGNGGMLLTPRGEMAEQARYLSTQAKDDPHEFFHRQIGFNYRLTNIHAALGLAQMEEVETRIAKKRAIAAFYERNFREWPGITLMPKMPHSEATYWLYTLLVETESQKSRLLKHLHQLEIMARPLFHPIHLLPPYREAFRYEVEEAEKIYQRGICLPSSLHLREAELQQVVDGLKTFLKQEGYPLC